MRYDTFEQSVVLTGWDLADATWTQLYYDDAAALAPKAQLALRRGLAGVGLWALGFDRGQPGYWNVLASLHRGLELSRIGVTPFLSKSLKVTLTIGWKSAGHAVTGVRLSNDGTTWSGWRQPARRRSPGRWRPGRTGCARCTCRCATPRAPSRRSDRSTWRWTGTGR